MPRSAAARGADDRGLADTILAEAPPAALWGPSPVTRASGLCLDVVRVLRINGGAAGGGIGGAPLPGGARGTARAGSTPPAA